MSQATLVETNLHSSGEILSALITLPKGGENIFFLAGSTAMNECTSRLLRRTLGRRTRNMMLPYRLRWYQGLGMVGFWEYPYGDDDEVWMQAKLMFDMNAVEGIYPKVRKDRIEV